MELIESFGQVGESLWSCWPFSCADRRPLATEEGIESVAATLELLHWPSTGAGQALTTPAHSSELFWVSPLQRAWSLMFVKERALVSSLPGWKWTDSPVLLSPGLGGWGLAPAGRQPWAYSLLSVFNPRSRATCLGFTLKRWVSFPRCLLA